LGTWDASAVDDGDYTIQLTTKNSSAQESIAQVRVIVDTGPPALGFAKAVDNVTIDLVFREQLSATLSTAYFSIPGLTLSNAVLRDDLKTVRLTTDAPQQADNPYTVTVRTTSPTVADVGGTEIVAPNNTANFNGFNGATAIPGDGNLLRRSGDDSTCGGTMMGCHNLSIHNSDVLGTKYGTWGREFTCLTCHDAHGTPNIFLIKQIIATPGGDRAVDFRLFAGGTEGVQDFTLGDAYDNENVAPCEVCHTQPGHFLNDDSLTTGKDHNNDSDCTSCHPHEQAFRLAGGGESSGGSACDTCHGSIYSPMNSDTNQYHHYQASPEAVYPVIADSSTLTATDSNKTCLMCHVDHDIFNPTLNANSSGRAENLRETIKLDVTVSSNFTDSDYSSSHADGGICLSCHTNSMTKNSTDQKSDGTTTTIAIDKAAFDAATTAHNYNATSSFSGSTFNANCSKCHSDTLPKSYQGSSGNAFALHASVLNWLLAPLGISSPTSGDDPLEEVLCQACHSGGASGSGPDYYNAVTMSQSAINVGDMFSKTYTHSITSTTGVHTLDERATASPGWNTGGTRHVECTDCHDAHGAQGGTHTVGSNIIGPALLGSWGVKPSAWDPVGGNQHTNFIEVDFTDASGSSDQFEAYLCFKCHSYYAYQNSPPNTPSGMPDGSPAVQTDVVTDFNPNHYAHHAAIAPGNNPNLGTFSQTFVSPWGPGSTVTCSDCHASDTSGDPAGTHGSANKWILRGNETGTGDAAVFCFNCHKYDVYDENGTSQTLSRVSHPINGQHIVPPQNGIYCMNCHGGAVLGGMHGTSAGVGPDGGVDELGYRFLNGASITGITHGTTSKNSGGCWTKGAVDSVNTCTKGHADMGWQSNY
jgi:hypothetical protein